MYGYRSYRRRFTRRRSGKRSIGTAGRLVPILRPPRISGLEQKLDALGVPVQRFKQYRYDERVNVTPTGGRCFWYCVPTVMETGNPLVPVDLYTGPSSLTIPDGFADSAGRARMKQAVSTADLFDVYRELVGTAGMNTNLVDSRSPAGISTGFTNTTAVGTGPTGYNAYTVPGALRFQRPGLDYTVRTQITYDNISSLDAFVEVYRLTYSGKNDHGTNTFNIGNELNSWDLNAYGGVTGIRFQYARGTTPHPGSEFVPMNDDALSKQEYQSAFFGGALLRAYGQVLCSNRHPPYALIQPGSAGPPIVYPTVTTQGAVDNDQETHDAMPAREGEGRNGLPVRDITQDLAYNAAGLPSRYETAQNVLCHPKVDPLRVLPRRCYDMAGFRFERVREVHRVKPGQSSVFHIPSSGTRHWDFGNSVHGRMNQLNTDIADAVDVPRSEVYCFRVWGDMIHGRNELETGLETDFQTGSCSLSFETQRVLWGRSKPRYFSTIVPQLVPFDRSVPITEQEHVNDESDHPQIVQRVGDDGPVV